MQFNDAISAIQALIKQGLSTRQSSIISANLRRVELEKEILYSFNNTIADGFFKGVRHTGASYGSLLGPKLLGTYEIEIMEDLIHLIKGKSVFIDIGCAEGYYTTGVAMKSHIPQIIGVDINYKALNEAKRSAKLNKVIDKCFFTSSMEEALKKSKANCLVMIDVDGSEREVIQTFLELAKRQKISDIDFIIETDFNKNGDSNEAEIKQLLKTNNCTLIKTIAQNPSLRISRLAKTFTNSFLDAAIIGMEGRPLNQKWIIAKI